MWTEEEKQKLVELYPTRTDKELCELIKKTTGQLRGMKSRLGLNKKYNAFSDEEKKRIIDFYTEHPDEMNLVKFAAELGRQKTSISRFARQYGLTTYRRSLTEEQRKKDSESHKRLWKTEYYQEVIAPQFSQHMKEWHTTHDHYRGMLGKHHTKDTRLRMSKAHKELWANKTDEERISHADRIRKWHVACGHSANDNTYSRCRNGKREDLGGMYFRSSWEANIARLLNKYSILWEYESKRFKFDDEGDSVLSYCPDFYLQEDDIWIEVKGWLDENSIKRLDRFERYYPEEFRKLVVIDECMYHELEKEFSNEVMFWEHKKNN